MPAASVLDNRTVGKNYGRCPSALAKGLGQTGRIQGDSLMLNTIPTTLLAPRQLSGLFLSKNKLPPKARARLAAEILEQRAVVTKLTVGQIASLCRVSVSSVNAARGGRGRKRQTSRSPGCGAARHHSSVSNSSDAPDLTRSGLRSLQLSETVGGAGART